MIQKNLVSIDLEPGLLIKSKQLIKEVTDLLSPYLVALSENEKAVLSKMHDGSVAFVNKAVEFCESNPEFIPAYLDTAEMQKDLKAYNDLKPVMDMLNTLHSNLEDTVTIAGSEAYAAARTYYNSVSYASKHGSLSAKPIMEKLSQRFPGSKKKKDDGNNSNNSNKN